MESSNNSIASDINGNFIVEGEETPSVSRGLSGRHVQIKDMKNKLIMLQIIFCLVYYTNKIISTNFIFKHNLKIINLLTFKVTSQNVTIQCIIRPLSVIP